MERGASWQTVVRHLLPYPLRSEYSELCPGAWHSSHPLKSNKQQKTKQKTVGAGYVSQNARADITDAER